MLYIILILVHFTFDWILQPRHIVRAKGIKDDGFNPLVIHMIINILPYNLILATLLYASMYKVETIVIICIINYATHFLIDLLLPKGKNERWIINWTAIDQMLHLSIMFGLIIYLK